MPQTAKLGGLLIRKVLNLLLEPVPCRSASGQDRSRGASNIVATSGWGQDQEPAVRDAVDHRVGHGVRG